MLKQMLEYSTLMMVPKDRLYVVANVVTNSTRLRQNKLDMTLFDTISKVQVLVKTVLFLFFQRQKRASRNLFHLFPNMFKLAIMIFFIDTFFLFFCLVLHVNLFLLNIFYQSFIYKSKQNIQKLQTHFNNQRTNILYNSLIFISILHINIYAFIECTFKSL